MAEFKSKGWTNPGYHYVIRPDGTVFHPLQDGGIANGVKGFNSDSIHVAYVGGIDSKGKAVDNRTEQQKKTLRLVLEELKQRYPEAFVLGHRDISPDTNHNGKVDPWERIKACPCFDVMVEFSYLNRK